MSNLAGAFDLIKDSVNAVKNIGQELGVDLPKYVAGKATGNGAAAEKARREAVKHGKQGLNDLNNVLKNSAIDEVVSKIPYGEKVRGPVTQGLDKIDDVFEKEMKRQGIIPGDKTASNDTAAPNAFDKVAQKRSRPDVLPRNPQSATKAVAKAPKVKH